MTNVIHTDKAPAAIGPYVQAVDLGNFVLTSGHGGATGRYDGIRDTALEYAFLLMTLE